MAPKPRQPPTDTSTTFGPGAVGQLVSGLGRKPPPKKKPLAPILKKGVTVSHPAPQPQPDTGFRAAVIVPPANQPPTVPTAKTVAPDLGTQTPPGPGAIPPFPSGPPLASLQRYGVNLGIQDVNQRVQDLTAAHLRLLGYKPTPEMIFDVLKAEGKTGPISYDDLFGIPTTPQQALAMITSRQGSDDEIASLPILTPTTDWLVRGIGQSLKEDAKHGPLAYEHADSNLHYFLKENNAFIVDAMKDPEQRDRLVNGMITNGVNDAARELPGLVQSAGWIPRTDTLGKAVNVAATAVGQIGFATTQMPYGFYSMGRAVALDEYNLALYGMHNLMGGNQKLDMQKVLHTTHILQQMGLATLADFEHPLRNPGYLTMDIWAALSAAAGTAGRVGAAGRAARAGEFSEAAKRLMFKARPEATPFRFGAYEEHLPLSDAAVVRVFQKYFPLVGRGSRLERLAAEHTDGYEAGDTSPAALVNRVISTPSMMRRVTSKRLAIDFAVAMTDSEEMLRLTRWDQLAKGVIFDNFFTPKRWGRLVAEKRAALERAMHLIMSDTVDPYGEWRHYHNNQLAALHFTKDSFLDDEVADLVDSTGVTPDEARAALMADKKNQKKADYIDYAIRSHEAQLESLEAGLEMIMNPTPEFEPLLERAYKVSRMQEDAKKEISGLSDEIADQHLGHVGVTLRGEPTIMLPTGLLGVTLEPAERIEYVVGKIAGYDKEIKKYKLRLHRERSTERLHPGTRQQAIQSLERIIATKERQRQPHQELLEKFQAEARPLHPAIGRAGRVSDEWLRQDVLRKLKEADIPHQQREGLRFLGVEFTRPTRSTNALSAVEFTPTHREYPRKAMVAPMESIPSTTDARGAATRLDLVHNRENTSNYVGALHEIGHAVHLTRAARDYEEMTTEQLHADVAARGLTDQRDSKWFWLRALDREGYATAWAVEHSAEPMRQVVLDQLQVYLTTYLRNAIHAGVDFEHDPIGENFIRTWQMLESETTSPSQKTLYGEQVANFRMKQNGPAYVPMFTERYRGETGRGFVGWRPSRFGVRPPEFPIHTWSGDSLKIGDYRWDVSKLLANQIGMALRGAQKMTHYQDLWESAVATPISPYHRPIRDIATIPDELRTYVTELERSEINPRLMDEHTDGRFDKLLSYLYPSAEDVRNGVVPHEHVRYVDERIMLDKMGGLPTQFWEQIDKALANSLGLVNEPMRLFLIFLAPAYLLNALGSAALLMIHTGPMAPIQFGRALMSSHWYGDEATRIFDRLAGQTHGASYEDLGRFQKGSHLLQEGWSIITDRYFRRAAVIHELKRQGLLEKDWDTDRVLAELKDPANSAKRAQAAQEARKVMLDFNSLSWPERAILRHMFFVYSFVRASGIWSLRFLRDHGVTADALAQAGKQRQQNLDEMIGPMPDWFMRGGYFAVHPGVIYNPIQWNMPGMLEQIMTPLSAMLGHTPYSSAAELMGPAPVMAMEMMTGKDLQGRALPETDKVPGGHGSIIGSILDQYNHTPVGLVEQKITKAERQQQRGPLPPPPVRSGPFSPIQSALARERAALNQAVFNNDGWWNQWGAALFRSGITKPVNRIAGEARYWRDLRENNPQRYHQHEMDMVQQMIDRQQVVLGRSAPTDVQDAVSNIARASQAIEDYKLQHQGEPAPNQKQINEIIIRQLSRDGVLKNRNAWLKRNRQAVDATTIRQIHVEILYAAGGKAWKQWVDEVNTIDNYAQPRFVGVVDKMNNLGLGDYSKATTQSRADRWSYGRQAERILTEAKTRAARVASLTGDEQKIAQQQWIQYVNENDHPITVNGVEYPSPFAYQFASKTTNEQNKAAAVYAKRQPMELTAFQTELLTGTRPKPVVTEGWQLLSTWIKGLRGQVPFGKGLPRPSLPGGGTESLYQFYGDYLAKKNPDFKKAWQFANQPLAKRLASYQTIRNSSHAADWQWLLSNVNQVYDDYYRRYEGKQGLITQAWKLRIPDTVALIHDRYPANGGFLNELGLYTGATSSATYDNYLSKFLVKLVAP